MGANLLPGNDAKITLGASTLIVGCNKFSASGVTRQTIDASEFGVDADRFVEGSANPGTISIADAIYDPGNAVQASFRDAVKNKTRYVHSKIGDTTNGLRFWLDDYTFLNIEDSKDAFLFVTKANDISTERNGLAKCSVEIQVSGGFLEQNTELTVSGAVTAASTAIAVNFLPAYVPQVVKISDGTNTYTTASWTGKTFTLSAAAGKTIADKAVIRLTW